ncbi:hypothetical protein pdam_00015328, partial [Pocillopora damicornis]
MTYCLRVFSNKYDPLADFCLSNSNEVIVGLHRTYFRPNFSFLPPTRVLATAPMSPRSGVSVNFCSCPKNNQGTQEHWKDLDFHS